MKNTGLKIVVPLVALAIAAIHALTPDTPKVDAITLALVVIALLPWLGSLIESLKYGDLEVKLRKAEVNAEEAKGAAESARQLALGQTEVQSQSALSGLTQTHLTRESAISEMQKLAVEYREKRMKNRPGDFRTALMTKIIHQMMALAPEVPQEAILPWLNDPDGAKRLAVYAYLYARPDFNEVDALLESVANRENPPFAQYWGIMALRKVIGARGEVSLKPATVSGLRAFLKTLRPGTDRYYELARLLTDLRRNPGAT
jgi:hypothetical protein